MAGPTPYPFLKSLATAAACAVVLAAGLVIAWGPPSAEGAGYLTGHLLITSSVPTLVTWLIARRAKTHWPWWKFAVVYVILFAAVVLVRGVLNLPKART